MESVGLLMKMYVRSIMFFFSGVCGLVLWRQKKAAGVEKLDG